MGTFFDLHRHDECSFFDGFGSPKELAKIAKEYGYPALGISNHGNITNLVRHWKACKKEGIKPILGCEVYFQPKFNKKNPQRQSYHLCLFVKNVEGYKNLCHMLTEANKEQYHYTAKVDLPLLKKYSGGLICTTACLASATSQAVLNGNTGTARRLLVEFKSIFDKDLYVEVQPYKSDNKHSQEKSDYTMMMLAKELKIRCILTSDSHYGKKEDFDTYCKMHEIGKTTLNYKATYKERYMPKEYEIVERFAEMYKNKFKDSFSVAEMFVDNMKRIYESVDADILGHFELDLPKIETKKGTSQEILVQLVKDGLKKRGKYKKEYIERCKEELNVIHYHGFDDYFVIVQDYVNWAKEHDIAVGYGRGSACNCLVAYAVGITDVDSIQYKLDFSRFMRRDKKKLPDIDVDFETSRRQEVIDYVVGKYKGKAVQICSYGEYQVNNLLNDLSGVCGLETAGKNIDDYEKNQHKKKLSEIKSFVNEYMIDGKLNMKSLLDDGRADEYNIQYDGIIKHFSKLYQKIRYLGKHAAGVAVVGNDISDYTCIVRHGDMFNSCYDLNDLESISCTKFDMLGLKTLSELKELKKLTGHTVSEYDRTNESLFEAYKVGNTDGIFQMEKSAPKKILKMIQCDSINDVIAVNALNRPAPLQLKMHETYAYNKLSGKADILSPYYKYTEETYGTMLYQEQTVEVAQKLGHLTAAQSFDLLKIMKKPDNLNKPEYITVIEQMKKDFFSGCKKEGLTREQTASIWGSMLIYGFNKGHSTGYALIGVDQMYYKLNYPRFFWCVKMKYANSESDLYKYSELAVKDGAVVMLPHVNYSADTSMRLFDGEKVIQQGLMTIKGVGEKAAKSIEAERVKNGAFKSKDEFVERCIDRSVNKRVINILQEQGALEFNKKRYLTGVVKYNSSLLGR